MSRLFIIIATALSLLAPTGLAAQARDGAVQDAVSPGGARAARLDELFVALAAAGPAQYKVIEDEIWDLWAQSGSATLDLLLQRGEAALEADDPLAAIEHFTALIDHAPDFAEAWNARATAYFLAGLYGPSLADIRQTLALEPRHFGAMTGLAIILEEAGESARALEVYRAVKAINPNRPEVIEAIERLERAAGIEDV